MRRNNGSVAVVHLNECIGIVRKDGDSHPGNEPPCDRIVCLDLVVEIRDRATLPEDDVEAICIFYFSTVTRRPQIKVREADENRETGKVSGATDLGVVDGDLLAETKRRVCGWDEDVKEEEGDRGQKRWPSAEPRSSKGIAGRAAGRYLFSIVDSTHSGGPLTQRAGLSFEHGLRDPGRSLVRRFCLQLLKKVVLSTRLANAAPNNPTLAAPCGKAPWENTLSCGTEEIVGNLPLRLTTFAHTLAFAPRERKD